MRKAQLQLQVLALHGRAVADTGDFQFFAEPFRHAAHEIVHQRALHAPHGAGAIALDTRRERNVAVAKGRCHFGHQSQLKLALGPFDRDGTITDRRDDALGQCHRILHDTINILF